MKALVIGLVLAMFLGCTPVRAQRTSPTVELDLTAGFSTEDVLAGASQLRIFGESEAGIRYYLDGAWATQTGTSSDAFGAGYPYEDGFYWLETYAEKHFQAAGLPGGVRLGRFRTPFGIYARSDLAYSGFLRAPLIRYADAFALSSYWLEGGAHVFIGNPALQLEASLGTPQEPLLRRRAGMDQTLRLQLYRGSVILGASYISTQPFQPAIYAHGKARFYGVDGRWMKDGVQLKGEWIHGRSFDGVSTDGWYLDAAIHRPWMGSITAVARYEELFYYAGPRSFELWRASVGARMRISRDLTGTANLVHQHQLAGGGNVAMDIALTYSLRH